MLICKVQCSRPRQADDEYWLVQDDRKSGAIWSADAEQLTYS